MIQDTSRTDGYLPTWHSSWQREAQILRWQREGRHRLRMLADQRADLCQQIRPATAACRICGTVLTNANWVAHGWVHCDEWLLANGYVVPGEHPDTEVLGDAMALMFATLGGRP